MDRNANPDFKTRGGQRAVDIATRLGHSELGRDLRVEDVRHRARAHILKNSNSVDDNTHEQILQNFRRLTALTTKVQVALRESKPFMAVKWLVEIQSFEFLVGEELVSAKLIKEF